MKQNLFLMLLVLGWVSSSKAQITRTQVGNTTYDLQTNNSMQRRLVVLPNGHKIATYTASQAGTADAVDRGTGYNYFDGTSWQVTSFPYPGSFSRPDSRRVGWPNPLVLDNSKEIILTHAVDASGSYGVHELGRQPLGTGPWTINSDITNDLATWVRAVNDGDSVLAIFSSSSGGTTNTSYQNGVLGGLGMIRSYDGGATWTAVDSIPGIGPGTYLALGGDQYAIDNKGKNIAIVTGENNVTLYKSSDFGNTWTHIDIINTTNFDSSKVNDANRSDGSYTVSFDNQGVVHVMFGLRHSFYDGTQASPGVYYTYADNGILYWNEHMLGQAPKLIPQTVLTNELHHGKYTLPYYNLNTNAGANQYNGYLTNLVSMPSLTVAPNGTLYASFSKLRPDNDTLTPTNRDRYGFNYNNVYVIKSLDGGATWIGPLDVSTPSDTVESTFGSIAKTVDGSVHVLFQENHSYGNAVGATNGSGFNGDVAFRDNKIIYAQVDTAAIVAPADFTNPVLNYNDAYIYDSALINNTINAYVGCPFSLTKTDLLRQYVTVFDNSVGSDTSLLQVFSNVNTSVPGTYYLYIIARDASGNTSDVLYAANDHGASFLSLDTVSFVIEVLNTDVTAPTVTLKGSDPTYIYYNTAYVDSGVIATDDNQCTLNQLLTQYSSNVDSSAPGTYHATYSVTDAAGNNTTVTRTVVVGKEPHAQFGVARLSGSTFKFIDSSLYAPTAWKWTIAPYNRTSTLRNYTTNFNKDTTITVCLVATNAYNFAPFNKPVDSTCKTLFIDFWGTGINDVAFSNNVHVYPNPSTGMMTVSLTDQLLEGGTVQVFNLLGEEVAAPVVIKANTDETSLNLTHLESGVYLVKVSSAQGSGIRKISITK